MKIDDYFGFPKKNKYSKIQKQRLNSIMCHERFYMIQFFIILAFIAKKSSDMFGK